MAVFHAQITDQRKQGGGEGGGGGRAQEQGQTGRNSLCNATVHMLAASVCWMGREGVEEDRQGGLAVPTARTLLAPPPPSTANGVF